MIRGLPAVVSTYRTKGVEAVVPKAYLVDIPAIANTQVFEDFQDQLALRDIVLSHAHDVEQSTELAMRLGSVLGSWVRYLHIWGAQDSCPGKSRGGKLQEKHSVQESSFDFYYGNPLQKSAAFPDILGECEDMFLQIKQQAAADVALWPSKEGFGMIHGDLSTKNVLIQAEAELRRQKPRLVIIDWELAQLNSQLRDIAQLLADLFLLQYFEGAELAVSVMQGFLQGSHCSQPEELASLSVHVGLHLLLFDITLPGPYPMDRINHLVSLARDLVVAGWERDHQKLQLNEFWALLRTV
ncbi:hypothetical protein NLG97_g796 [Lecanicillium saksenae]|uniref:Uncharacterized protein n=1 Tax=Lecanicillium saksenae TaxID=468837 RepID=A0ACC1R5R5_9HYPO|nr:hypothetical protein NLG97_g796 [Lecanicillium saksenae]